VTRRGILLETAEFELSGFQLTHSFLENVEVDFCVDVRFEVLTAVVMKSPILWPIAPRSLLKVNRRFGGTSQLHLQGQRIKQETNQHEAGNKQLWLLFCRKD
jgi:hypothetical protein